MTTAEADAPAIFADAREMHAAALDRLDAGDIRAAAEQAWCATWRATDALILARTGEVPPSPSLPDTDFAIRSLSFSDPALWPLRARYATCAELLHGDCFQLGLCEPLDDTERLIRQTADYIADAERLAREGDR